MLMSGIYSRQVSDPSPAMSDLDCGRGYVKKMKGAVLVPQLQDTMRQEKSPPLFSAGCCVCLCLCGGEVGGSGCQHWRQSQLNRPEHAGSRGEGGLLPGVTGLGSRLYLPPRLQRCRG